jgi:hypothetical protein
MLGLIGLYWVFGMPAIGICFIVNAILTTGRRSGARRDQSPLS